jgi:hypothetical protein
MTIRLSVLPNGSGQTGATFRWCAMSSKWDVKEGEIVQLSPETCRSPLFAGCLMVVSEPKGWGAQGYVQSLGKDERPGGQAYYRAKWEEMERTGGMAPFVIA